MPPDTEAAVFVLCLGPGQAHGDVLATARYVSTAHPIAGIPRAAAEQLVEGKACHGLLVRPRGHETTRQNMYLTFL